MEDAATAEVDPLEAACGGGNEGCFGTFGRGLGRGATVQAESEALGVILASAAAERFNSLATSRPDLSLSLYAVLFFFVSFVARDAFFCVPAVCVRTTPNLVTAAGAGCSFIFLGLK
jgi:hypothetical protein